MSSSGLNPRQNAFVAEYLKDLNATQAAIRAGYPAGSASVKGSQLLANAKIKRLIKEAIDRRAQRVEVQQDDVLRELVRVMSVDIGKAFDVNGHLLPMHEIPEDTRRALAGVEAEELWEGHGEDREHIGTLRKVKFLDKTRALELAMRHLGLLNDKVQLEGVLTLEQLVTAAATKASK